MLVISNTFSINMLAQGSFNASIVNITVEQAKSFAQKAELSAVGHADTAAIFSSLLDLPIQTNRISVSLTREDSVLVGQYKGPRLAEGAEILPDGASIDWYIVELK